MATFSTRYRRRIASFSGPLIDFRSRFMESSRFTGYANPNTRTFQLHLKQDSKSLVDRHIVRHPFLGILGMVFFSGNRFFEANRGSVDGAATIADDPRRWFDR